MTIIGVGIGIGLGKPPALSILEMFGSDMTGLWDMSNDETILHEDNRVNRIINMNGSGDDLCNDEIWDGYKAIYHPDDNYVEFTKKYTDGFNISRYLLANPINVKTTILLYKNLDTRNPNANMMWKDGNSPYPRIYFQPTGTLSVSEIVRTDNTSTATAAAHGYSSDNTIQIAGANEIEYNGDFVITVLDVDTFTYTVAGTPDTPATGTITAREINNNNDRLYLYDNSSHPMRYAFDGNDWSSYAVYTDLEDLNTYKLAILETENVESYDRFGYHSSAQFVCDMYLLATINRALTDTEKEIVEGILSRRINP